MGEMQLFLVGAGTPVPTSARFGTCQVLVVADDHLMFDCGPAATHKLVKMGLSPIQIDHLFLSHHHYDHNVDYACFLLTRWNLSIGHEQTLCVWGPPPTEWITERLIGPDGVFATDWIARTRHPDSLLYYEEAGGVGPRPAPEVQVQDIDSGKIAEKSGWVATAARAKHQEPWLRTLAYRVDSDEGSIVFAGDTVPCAPVAQLAQGADTLVVSCWDHQHTLDGSERPSIMGTLETARFAQQAGVKRLVLTHIHEPLDQPGSKEKAIADVARLYKGEIIFGQESMSYAF
jgi:ribonuclease BN (tRNA processing enzyme)